MASTTDSWNTEIELEKAEDIFMKKRAGMITGREEVK